MTEETHKKTGFILSIIGGLASIALTFGLRFVYPEIASLLGNAFVIVQMFTLVGGILILIGVSIAFLNIKVGKIFILISGIIAGGNVLAIGGAVLLTKKVTTTKAIYKSTFPFICDSCKQFTHTFAEYCENCGAKDSLREATPKDYEKERVTQ
ncbi:MAG: hypothetical protein ACFE9Z_17490 [Promethearchaeota archaeon]